MTAADATETHGYFAWPHDAKRDDDPVVARAAAFYRANGYAVLTGHLPPPTAAALLAAGNAIIADFLSDPHRVARSSTFTTDNEKPRPDDTQLFASAAGVDCFLEEAPSAPGDAAPSPPRPAAVNKIGHALHDVDATFRAATRTRASRAAATAVCGLAAPLPVQSMYIVKGARVGGAVPPHRDATFVRAASRAPGDCAALWWALEAADAGNGCLRVVPGSHADGRRVGVFARRGARAAMEVASDCAYDEAAFVDVPVGPGDAVLLHGGVVHASRGNESGRSRHAYSVHVVEGALAEECWLRRDETQAPFEEL